MLLATTLIFQNNLIIYSSIDQRILATVFCGGGHRAWDISFANDNNFVDFVCSSSCGKLEAKRILLNGQYTLRVLVYIYISVQEYFSILIQK